MNSLEIVEDARRRYVEIVRPKIQNRNYVGAYVEMDSIVTAIRGGQGDIIVDVHCGISFVAAAQILYRELEKGEPRKETVEEFEAWLAQTKLPKQRAEDSEE